MSSTMFYLEIGEKILRVIDAVAKDGGFEVQAAGAQPIQGNFFASQAEDVTKVLTESIKKLIADSKITKRNVSIVIPDSHSYSRVITMPLLTEKELISAIRFQADQFIPIPIDKVNLDIEVLHEDKPNKQLSVLLVAAPTMIVQRLNEIVTSLGLFPEVVTNQASTSLRFIDTIAHAHADVFVPRDDSTLLFLQCGVSASSIYLVDGKTFQPIQIHTFPLGQEVFGRAMRANFQIDDQTLSMLLEKVGFHGSYQAYDVPKILGPVANEYATEIKRFMTSTQQDGKKHTQSMYLMGAGARIAGLDQFLSQQLQIPTSLLNPLSYLGKNAVVDYFAADWVSFVALLGATID